MVRYMTWGTMLPLSTDKAATGLLLLVYGSVWDENSPHPSKIWRGSQQTPRSSPPHIGTVRARLYPVEVDWSVGDSGLIENMRMFVIFHPSGTQSFAPAKCGKQVVSWFQAWGEWRSIHLCKTSV